MVDQSERAFRLLCREYGTGLAYTPMLHARLFCDVPTYRALHFDAHADDHPVIAQLAGHDPEVVLKAARMIEGEVDAIDLNFGCPQGIARKGRYGAFLLDEPDVMVSLVSTLADGLSIPVTAKLRLLPDRSEALQLCKRLEDAGAAAVALHGRTREQNKHQSGSADWDAIKACVELLDIPVIANGGIGSADDAEACRKHTGAAAIMSSEALLENPALFCRNVHPLTGAYLDQTAMAQRYLEICATHPPTKGAAMVRGHLFKLLHNGLRTHTPLRDELLVAQTLDEMGDIVQRLDSAGWEQPAFHAPDFRPHTTWYMRHRPTGTSGTEDGALDTSTAEGRLAAARARGGRVKVSGGLKEALARDRNGGTADAEAADGGGQEEARAAAAQHALERRQRKEQERKRRNQNRAKGGPRRQRRAAAKQAGLLQ